MEKRKPSYLLGDVKRVLGSEKGLAIKASAFASALALGFDRQAIADVVAGVMPGMFIKSMTTYADHRLWQDVYHVPSDGIVLYVKFQADLLTEFTIVSFKEK